MIIHADAGLFTWDESDAVFLNLDTCVLWQHQFTIWRLFEIDQSKRKKEKKKKKRKNLTIIKNKKLKK